MLADVERGAVKLLYIAPEKLLTPAVLLKLRSLPQISLVGWGEEDRRGMDGLIMYRLYLLPGLPASKAW